jgi:uncharacterized protein YjaZ
METNELKINKAKVNVHFLFLKKGLNELKLHFKVMGFKDREDFDSLLGKLVFFGESEIKNDKIKEIGIYINEALNSCFSILKDEEMNIFLFETKDQFITNKMDGSSGFCTNRNCILILLNLKSFTESTLKNTLVHELTHAINPHYDMGHMSVGEGIVFDGVAENFREITVDKNKSKMVLNIKEKDISSLFIKIKPILGSKNRNDYSDVFFGTGKYPLWAGYALGYYLIKKYISRHKNLKWKDILRKDPNEILKDILLI